MVILNPVVTLITFGYFDSFIREAISCNIEIVSIWGFSNRNLLCGVKKNCKSRSENSISKIPSEAQACVLRKLLKWPEGSRRWCFRTAACPSWSTGCQESRTRSHPRSRIRFQLEICSRSLQFRHLGTLGVKANHWAFPLPSRLTKEWLRLHCGFCSPNPLLALETRKYVIIMATVSSLGVNKERQSWQHRWWSTILCAIFSPNARFW